jgi:hypothetical protein
METRSVIDRLVADLRPVTPLRVPSARLVRWVPIAVASGIAALAAIGIRPDLLTATLTAPFVGHSALLIAAAVTSAAGALCHAVPGERLPRWMRSAPGITILAWSAWLAVESASHVVAGGDWAVPASWGCVAKAFAVGVVPSAALAVMVGRAAPMRPLPAVTFAALSGVAVGALGAELSCPLINPLHLLLWHAAPAIGTVLVIAAGCGAIVAASESNATTR